MLALVRRIVDGQHLHPGNGRFGNSPRNLLIGEALLRKGCVRDSSGESSMVAGLHEQTHPAALQDQELACLQQSAEAAWLPGDLVRSGHGLGAAADRQARPTAAV